MTVTYISTKDPLTVAPLLAIKSKRKNKSILKIFMAMLKHSPEICVNYAGRNEYKGLLRRLLVKHIM